MPGAALPRSRQLLRARDLVDARYAEPLTVADLAAAAGMSPSHFSRSFRAAFGESPHQYLLTRRLERAAALLRTTDWSVARVCFAVGWGSVGSFTASFRRVHGRSPTRYRAAFPPAAAAQLRIPTASPSPTAGRGTARFEKTARAAPRRVRPDRSRPPRRTGRPRRHGRDP